jgi:adenylosuccinate synthase
MDILDEMATIKVCVAYEIDGERVEHLPADPALLFKCQPIYEELAGWQQSVSTIVDFDELPPEAAQFVQRIEQLVGVPADIVSVGPARAQTISRRQTWGED